MNIQSYIESCKKFAHDTQEWAALNKYRWYTTSTIDGWRETEGNEHDGIDVKWAFHMNASDIEKQAPQKFVELLIDEMYFIDEPLYYEDVAKIAEKFQ